MLASLKEGLLDIVDYGDALIHQIATEWDKNVFARADELERQIDKTYFEVITPFFVSSVTKYLKSNSRIIDVGTGLGFLARELSDHAREVRAIDISTKSIDYAKFAFSKGNLFFEDSSLVRYSKQVDTKFDACIANMFFQNAANLDKDLDAIKSLLKSQGYLFVSIPHPAFWMQSHQGKLGVSPEYKKETKYSIPFKIRLGKIHPSPITYFHRPLDAYMQAFLALGFELVDFIEPENKDVDNPVDLLFMSFKSN